MSEHFRIAALTVPCPTCKADRLADCHAPLARLGVHGARVSRGLTAAWRDEAAQHARAHRALQRVRGGAVDRRTVTTALACGCSECLRGNEELGRELDQLGLLDTGAAS